MFDFPSKISRRERLPECFSCVSVPSCTLRNPSGSSQEKPPPVTLDSNPPSHRTEPGGLCKSTKPAKTTPWSHTPLPPATRLSRIKPPTTDKQPPTTIQ